MTKDGTLISVNPANMDDGERSEHDLPFNPPARVAPNMAQDTDEPPADGRRGESRGG